MARARFTRDPSFSRCDDPPDAPPGRRHAHASRACRRENRASKALRVQENEGYWSLQVRRSVQWADEKCLNSGPPPSLMRRTTLKYGTLVLAHLCVVQQAKPTVRAAIIRAGVFGPCGRLAFFGPRLPLNPRRVPQPGCPGVGSTAGRVPAPVPVALRGASARPESVRAASHCDRMVSPP